jgi:hypothetical protein
MTVPLLYQAVARSRAVVKTVCPDKLIICLTAVSRLPPHQIGPS